MFDSVQEARLVVNRRLDEYNIERLHGALAGVPPVRYVKKLWVVKYVYLQTLNISPFFQPKLCVVSIRYVSTSCPCRGCFSFHLNGRLGSSVSCSRRYR